MAIGMLELDTDINEIHLITYSTRSMKNDPQGCKVRTSRVRH